MNGLIGKKIGMTSIYDSTGRNIACTVIETGPCVVTQIKTSDTDGYNALQLGFGEARVKNTTKALKGHFEAANTTPKSNVIEFRDFNAVSKSIGDAITVDEIFSEGSVPQVQSVLLLIHLVYSRECEWQDVTVTTELKSRIFA
jgi:large subunit ribosomal protein L3